MQSYTAIQRLNGYFLIWKTDPYCHSSFTCSALIFYLPDEAFYHVQDCIFYLQYLIRLCLFFLFISLNTLRGYAHDVIRSHRDLLFCCGFILSAMQALCCNTSCTLFLPGSGVYNVSQLTPVLQCIYPLHTWKGQILCLWQVIGYLNVLKASTLYLLTGN